MSSSVPKTGLAPKLRAWMRKRRGIFDRKTLYAAFHAPPGHERELIAKALYDFVKRGEVLVITTEHHAKGTKYRYASDWVAKTKQPLKKSRIYRAMYVSTTFAVSDVQRLAGTTSRSLLDKTAKRLVDGGFLHVVGFRSCDQGPGKEKLYHIPDRTRFKLEVQR